MIVPRAELPLVPHEIVAHARAAADGALHQRQRGPVDAVEHVFGDVLGIEQQFFAQRLGSFRVPAGALQDLQVAQRPDERVPVLRRKRLIDPADEVVGGDVDALAALAEHGADGRPRQRDQIRGNLPVLGAQAADVRQRVVVAADDERAALGTLRPAVIVHASAPSRGRRAG